MKQDTHPQTYPVVFVDTSAGAEFYSTSTLKSNKTREKDGVTYFELPIEISSASHPFFTGKQVFVDTARRVEKFKEKMEKQAAASEARKGKAAKKAARSKKDKDTDESK